MEANKQELAVKAEHIKIYRLEEALKTLPQTEMPVCHDFCNGLYARTLIIPAGTVLTGAVHKEECFFLVRSGEILLTTDDKPVRAGAGFMAISKAGSKRAGVAITDTLVTTFHANPQELREPGEIWDFFTVPPPANLLESLDKTRLEGI